jgi:N utilization substance protein A
MKSEFEIAITQLSADRNLSPEVIIEAIEAALVSAYKRNFGASQSVRVSLDPHTGQAHVYVTKTVAEQAAEDSDEIALADARAIQADISLGDALEVEVQPRNFGRIAAQTAKQVITQRIREAERDSVYLEYVDRVGELVNGVIRNIDGPSHNVIFSMGKAEALLLRNEQIPGEHYRFNQRLRVYITGVERSGRGPQILVSRTHRDLLRRLLELEVPEILNGTVEVKAIAREPGARSKVAVAALQPGIDPVGSCVGMRGVRIQNIVNELNGEKIDVVEWSSDEQSFIANALSPARVLAVYLNKPEQTAKVVVPDRALSLAIGKEGQNARLAAKLTGWRIDIKSETEAADEAERMAAEMEAAAEIARGKEAARLAAAALLAEAEVGLDEEEALVEAPVAESELAETFASAAAETDAGAKAEADAQVPESELTDVDALVAGLDEVEQPGEDAEEPAIEAAPVDQEAEAQPSPAEATPAEPVEEWVDDTVTEEESEGEGEEKGRHKKGRRLEYDERLGQVVAKKQRKENRRGRGWQDWEDNS